MANRIQLRRDTGANWASVNPVLAQGEVGIETDAVPIQIKIGDGSTAWNNLPYIGNSSEIYVTSFGADPTGVLDSSDAIISAINSVPNGGIIVFPNGTYLISKSISISNVNNIKIIGSGNSIIHAEGFNGQHFDLIDCRRWTFENLTLIGEGIDAERSIGGIYIHLSNNDNNPNHTFRNLLVKDITNDGIAIATPILCVLENVTVRLAAGHCFNMYMGTSVSFISCYALTCTQGGFHFNGMTYCSLNSCAAEVNGVAYDFVNSKAMVMYGCGSEDILNRSIEYPGIAIRVNGKNATAIACYSRSSAGGHLQAINSGVLHYLDFYNGDTGTNSSNLS